MSELDINSLDLNLLKVFSATLQEGNVTAAGERLGLAQSTVSHSLSRLREAFRDPLFVRSGRGLQPTALAMSLREPVARALDILQEAFSQNQGFDPATSTRTFTLLMIDIGEAFFVPPLIARLRRLAPRVRVVVRQVPRQLYKEALESGAADLAIGQLPQKQTDLMQQILFHETFEGLARPGHPILANPSMEAFLAADHLVVGSPAVAEIHLQKALGSRAATRKIALELPHYLAAPFVLEQTDLIAVLPRTVSECLTSVNILARFRPPLRIEPLAMRQFWHARSTHDEGCKWLRNLVAEIFTYRGNGAKRTSRTGEQPAVVGL